MLGDNAIVVIENVTRLREEGRSLPDSTLEGAQEIGTAVTASTLTNVAIFIPIVFVEGVAAHFFVDMGITMTIALMVSLIVAVTLVPMLVSQEGAGWSTGNARCFAGLSAFRRRYGTAQRTRPGVAALHRVRTFAPVRSL
jgi:multidrug efflux pump subunit AcrB